MVDNLLFISTVRKLTERNLTIVELIQAAEALKASGQVDLGAELYQQWIALNQGSPLLYAIHFNYSVLLTARGDLAGARDALECALAVKPDFYPAHINLG